MIALVPSSMMAGTVAGDLGVVLLGAYGMRRVGDDRAVVIRRLLALLLGALGAWLLIGAILG